MTKYFRVGERVRNISNGCYNVGDELIIVKDDYSDSIPLLCRRVNDGKEDWVGRTHVKRVSDTSARLTEAEAKVAALEAEVETMKCQIYSLEKNKADTPALAAITQRTFQPKKSPNQRRADVIKRAQAFVADIIGEYPNFTTTIGRFNNQAVVATFHVNAEKRTVVALVHGYFSRKLAFRGIAKCAPDDVFHADIGKAIALGYARGVDIPKEFTDAAKPTEVVVGMRVRYSGKSVFMADSGRMGWREYGFAHIRSHVANTGIIIDDTEAVYA